MALDYRILRGLYGASVGSISEKTRRATPSGWSGITLRYRSCAIPTRDNIDGGNETNAAAAFPKWQFRPQSRQRDSHDCNCKVRK